MNKKQKKMLIRILLSAAMLIGFNFLPVTGLVRFVLYLIPYVVIGYDILVKAFKGIKNRQPFDESLLMAIATLGAIVLAIYSEVVEHEAGDYVEAIAVMRFYQVGEWFQSYAVGKSRRNISDLMDIRPDYANIEADGKLSQWTRMKWSRIRDRCAARGESAYRRCDRRGQFHPQYKRADRGEPAPRCERGRRDHQRMHQYDRRPEDPDHERIWGLHRLEDPGPGGECQLKEVKIRGIYHKICPDLYPGGRLQRHCSCGTAAPGAHVWHGHRGRRGTWIYRALTFLVISCPCALVISIPLSFFAGIGGAAMRASL